MSFEPTQCYKANDLPIMILGRDEDHPEIIFICIYAQVGAQHVQVSFAPIHKDVLEASLTSELLDHGTPNEELYNDCLEAYRFRGSCYFTQNPRYIMEVAIKMRHETGTVPAPSEHGINLGMIFPASVSQLEDLGYKLWEAPEGSGERSEL